MHKAGEAFGLPAASLEKLEQVRVGAMDALDRAHRAGVNLVYGLFLIYTIRRK